MRTPQRLSKTVTAAVLGATLALAVGGTGAASAATPAPGAPVAKAAAKAALTPATRPSAAKLLPWRSASASEARFQKWAGNILDSCLPARTMSTSGVSATSDGINRIGDSFPETPLGLIGECVGGTHQRYITRAFTTGPADYAELRARLIALGYPAARIYQMRDHTGQPVARIDLRLPRPDGRLASAAVDVTAYRTLVTAEPFGVPASPEVHVTLVEREPEIYWPTS
ncbi:hypothetical protein [Streptomyces sp. NPDC058955]|uniref:hypothetical protein n=1 Tax=unclassified Streptomyces TaxID=2593676 RepID=UPI0036542786